MRQTTGFMGIFLCLGALSQSGLALDQQLLGMVMPDAQILAGANATNFEASPFGQFVIAKVGPGNLREQRFVAATGFNPLQDVTEVLAATAASPSDPGGLLLARGNFNVAMILSAVAGRPNVQVGQYNGYSTITVANPREKTPFAVAFAGGTIAVAGNLTQVQAALGRVNAPASINQTLAATAAQLSAADDEWMASSTSPASIVPAKALSGSSAAAGSAAPIESQLLPMLKNIQSFNGGVKFGDNVQFTGQAVANDANNAGALAAVIKLGEIFLSSNTSVNSHPRLADLVQMLQGLQVTTSGTAVNVSLSVPEAQIEAMLNTPRAAGALRPKAR